MREVGRIKTRSAWKSSGQALAAWQDLRRANVKTRVTHHRANKRGKTPSKSIRCREGGEERNAERTSRQLWMHYLSAGRLLWLFRKSQQSSTASFAQWLFAIVPASFRRFSRSFRPGYCLCVGCPQHSSKYDRPTPNPLYRLSSIKFPLVKLFYHCGANVIEFRCLISLRRANIRSDSN